MMASTPSTPVCADRPTLSRKVVMALAVLLFLLLIVTAAQRFGQLLPDADRLSIWLIIHLTMVIPAVPLGFVILYRRKGDGPHRLLGRLWATMMMVAAVTSFGIRDLTGGLSVIHLLSLLTIVSIPYAIWNVRRGNFERHQRTMTAVYWGLIVAGLFTFLPARLLGSWLIG